MTIQEAEEKLENYLLHGLQAELHWAKEARAVAMVVGNHSQRTNNTRFRFLFGRLQEVFSERETLSVAKIFDRPNRRNPIRSISTTLDLLEEHADLWNLRERDFLENFLHKNGYCSMSEKTDREISIAVVEVYKSNLPLATKKDSCQLSNSLDAVLQSRDKVHAHNEAVLASERTLPSWKDTKVLIDYAEDFIGTIIRCFLGIAYIVNEPNLISKHLEQLMAVSNLVNEEYKSEQRNLWVVERLRKELFESN
ncbi:MAG TPA: hypothetical protein VGP58_13000 [Pyrinomonadaceae bacterium]|jgi:hypothetical protein|nr:hypothetical protein [Pyrinomonadaceae bacterium]